MSAPRVSITDHALIRWLTRAKDIDMEFFREALRREVEEAALAGAAQYTTGGCVYIFENRRLITVLDEETMRARRKPKKARWFNRTQEPAGAAP